MGSTYQKSVKLCDVRAVRTNCFQYEVVGRCCGEVGMRGWSGVIEHLRIHAGQPLWSFLLISDELNFISTFLFFELWSTNHIGSIRW
jgi:hypothetical protein